MKKVSLLLGAAICALALNVSAAPTVDTTALKHYAEKLLQKCPEAKVSLEPIPQQGPRGFVIYKLTQTSSDTSCGRQTFLIYSPTSQQVVLGSVFVLPADSRPIDTRVAEQASTLLKQPMTVTVSGFPLPDGLRAVAMTKQTEYGPFSYHGFVDGSGQFLIVGTRGSLNIDASKTLRESIGAPDAVRRGNPKSSIEIIELSDFQCPTCGRAHQKVEPIIEKNLSKINYARLDLPLYEHHEWSLSAALGARAIEKVAPKVYWSYVNFIFSNQDKIKKETIDKMIQGFCEDHNVDWKAVEKLYRAPEQKKILLEQVSRAFDNGIVSTPTYIINGQMMGYGPEGAYTIEQINKAIASAK